MKLSATPLTAALAGVFSAVTWPLLWPFLNGTGSSATLGAVAGMLLFIALPAHAFVVGFKPGGTAPAQGFDTALLKRVGAWLLGATAGYALVAFR